ncbi:putative phytoene synthase [Rosellinia necatrix]|uniref:Bifunctional lycopene cyclase/phytoene synthase n=1 Tax=Rosellinia necatrix TaxID=77044 RepID=A0A1W2TU49_ROSNE|nr:putative phytoene synthase [Rosellinia necatrix]
MAYEYAFVLLKYTIPPAVFLTAILRPLLTRLDLYKILILILAAFFATVPWDSLLIRLGVWTYPPDAVIGWTFFKIPVEELFFIVIQTYITSLLYILIHKPVLHAQFLSNYEDSPRSNRRISRFGCVYLCLEIIRGVSHIALGGKLLYSGLIIVWAAPVILLSWTSSAYFLLRIPKHLFILSFMLPTIYLSVVDEFALSRGIWVIETGTKIDVRVFGSLEFEEAYFFMTSNFLIALGMAALDKGAAVLDTLPGTRAGGSRKASLVSLVRATFMNPNKYNMKRIRGIRKAIETIQKRSQSFYLASSLFTGRLRTDLVLLYSFCRVADDLVDGSRTEAEALAWIQKLTSYFDLVYGNPNNRHADSVISYTKANFPEDAQSALELLPTTFLPSGPLYELINGFKMDLAFARKDFPIKDEAAIQVYARRVASTVGELCLRLVFHHSSVTLREEDETRLLEAAVNMGYALQYVNIARDIEADAEIGRVYLPTTWLKEGELTPQDVLSDPTQPKIEAVRQRLLGLAFREYSRSRNVMSLLPDEVRGPLVVAVESYMEIGRVLRERRVLAPGTKGGRVTVPRLRSLWVAWKNMQNA